MEQSDNVLSTQCRYFRSSKLFLTLSHCHFSLNLSGPLVSTQMKIDNRRKTTQEGSVALFSMLAVFFESVISIKKQINCWLIQHTSQLRIKRASWGLQSPKDGRCCAHIQAYFIRLWNIELVCGSVYDWVSVLLELYVNLAVTPLSAAGDGYLGHVGRYCRDNDAIWS